MNEGMLFGFSNVYRNIRSVRLWKTACVILSIFVVILLILAYLDVIPSFTIAWKEIGSSALGALVGVILFDGFRGEKERLAHDKYIASVIWDILQARNNTLIKNLYKESAIDNVVKNCLSHYCQVLSNSQFEYIKSNMNSFRAQLSYFVKVRKSANKFDENNIPLYEISQELSYKRYFRVKDVTQGYKFKCYFAFSEKALEDKLQKNHYFFREVLLEKKFIAELKSYGDNKIKIMERLHLKMFLTDMKIPYSHQLINMEVDEGGILFYIDIPDSDIELSSAGKVEDEVLEYATDCYASYCGKIQCKLSSYNYFYAIFAEPCIDPQFTIKVDSSIPFEKLQYVSCLSVPGMVGYNTKDVIKESSLRETVELNLVGNTIFPRSGIYFNW